MVTVPWGASVNALVGDGFALVQKFDARSYLLDEPAAYFGLDIAHVETFQTKYRLDRPIEQVWYAIRSSAQQKHRDYAREIHQRFIKAWGEPDDGEETLHFEDDSSSGDIAGYAEWRCNGVSVRLSWYGAQRESHGAITSGFIALECDDLIAMSAPFVHGYRLRQQALDALSGVRQLASLRMKTTPVQPHQRYHFDAGDASQVSTEEIEAYRALHAPDVLNTSATLKKLIDHNDQLVLWQAGVAWGVSSRDITLFVDHAEPVATCWDHVVRGRGPGYESITVGSLNASADAKALADCGDIQFFVDALQRLSLVKYEFNDYPDY